MRSLVRRALVVLVASGLATDAFADCAENFKPGVTQIRETVNPKGKPRGKSITEIKSVVAGSDALVATLHTVDFDKKGKPIGAFDYDVACKGEGLVMDMRAFWPADQSAAYQEGNWDMTVVANVLEYPKDGTPGLLPGGQMNIKYTMKNAAPNMPPTDILLAIRDRNVVGPERAHTPARDFDAVKITSRQTVTTTTFVGVTITMDVTEWYVPGLGVVKSEVARNGRSWGTTTLVELR